MGANDPIIFCSEVDDYKRSVLKSEPRSTSRRARKRGEKKIERGSM